MIWELTTVESVSPSFGDNSYRRGRGAKQARPRQRRCDRVSLQPMRTSDWYRAADEIIEALNQNTVLIEEDEIAIEYYGGN